MGLVASAARSPAAPQACPAVSHRLNHYKCKRFVFVVLLSAPDDSQPYFFLLLRAASEVHLYLLTSWRVAVVWEPAVHNPAKHARQPSAPAVCHGVRGMLRAALLMACRNLLLNPGPCAEAAVRLAIRRLREHGDHV